MTQEEFLESRRKHKFLSPYTDEEAKYWMEQATIRAKENAGGHKFPAIKIHHILEDSNTIDKNKI